MIRQIGTVLVVTILGAHASAQPVFVDDFNGSQLAPHWVQPPTSHWVYDVSGGMLNVHDLLYPSAPKAGWNWVDLEAPFTAPAGGNLEMTVRLGWDSWALFQQRFVAVSLLTSGGVLGGFSYHDDGLGAGLLYVGSPFGSSSAQPAPATGPFDVAVIRGGGLLQLFSGGNFLASAPEPTGAPVVGLELAFWATFPHQGSPAIYMDHIEIVPSPSALLVCGAALLLATRRRR